MIILRQQEGEFATLFAKLREDETKFFNYFRKHSLRNTSSNKKNSITYSVVGADYAHTLADLLSETF